MWGGSGGRASEAYSLHWVCSTIQECLACILCLAILWWIDVSRIECRHAAIRRLLRGLGVSWTKQLEDLSADFLLLRQRLLEAQSGNPSSEAPGTHAATQKAPQEKPRKGAMGQRCHFSEVLRSLRANPDEWKCRKRLFTEANAQYSQEKQARSEYYERCRTAGILGVQARSAGGAAFGPTSKAAARTATPALAPPSGVGLVSPCSALAVTGSEPSALALRSDYNRKDVVALHKAHRNELKTLDVAAAGVVGNWSAAKTATMTGDTMCGAAIAVGGSKAVPTFPGVDVLEWVPPARAVVDQALSGRKKWKDKSRQKSDIEFKDTMRHAWTHRHLVKEHSKLPKIHRWVPPLLKQCYFVGFCICRACDLPLRQLVKGFQRMLAHVLRPDTTARRHYDGSTLVLRIKAPSTGAAWYHVAWGNLNSRWFTLYPLRVSHDPGRVQDAIALGGLVPLDIAEGAASRNLPSMWNVLVQLDPCLMYTVVFFSLARKDVLCTGFVPGHRLLVEPLDLTETFERVQPPARPHKPRKRRNRAQQRRPRPRRVAVLAAPDALPPPCPLEDAPLAEEGSEHGEDDEDDEEGEGEPA